MRAISKQRRGARCTGAWLLTQIPKSNPKNRTEASRRVPVANTESEGELVQSLPVDDEGRNE